MAKNRKKMFIPMSELSQLIKQEVFDSFPPKVEYSITEHGMSLEKVLDEMHFWGLLHRKRIMSGF